EMITPWTRERSRDELLHLFQANGGASAAIYSPSEAMEVPHSRLRGFRQDVELGDGARFTLPGIPYAPGESADYVRRPAPRLGERGRARAASRAHQRHCHRELLPGRPAGAPRRLRRSALREPAAGLRLALELRIERAAARFPWVRINGRGGVGHERAPWLR